MRTYGEAIEVRTAEPVETAGSAGLAGLAEPARSAAAVPGGFSSHEPAAASSSSVPSVTPAPPAQFLWRGRLYLVREVLAHWVELGTWWTARAPRTSVPADPHAPAPGSGGTAYDPFGSSDGPPAVARSVAADVGAVEREVWRVEAASGRTARVGVYDLVRDVPAAHPSAHPSGGPSDRPAPERWRLARALD